MNRSRIARRCVLAFAVALSWGTSATCHAADLIPEALAQQQGLTRAWFSQVQLDPSRYTVERAILAGDQLFVLTTSGTLHTFDAETGQTLWVTRIGEPRYTSLGPAVGKRYAAVVNGTTVFVVDRVDGREIRTFRTSGGVSSAPAIVEGYVYVPLFNGRLEGFAITDERLTPWYYTSSGRLFQPPIAASQSVVWTNDRGKIYGGNAAQAGVRYWFEGGAPFVAPPAALGTQVFAATITGYVYALEEAKGRRQWQYSSGSSVRKSPVAIGNELYVATEEPALHAIDSATGEVKWITGGVAQFVAASETRLYGLDDLGSFLVLDRKTGSPISRVANRGEHSPVLNQQSDRLYIFSDDGLVQCFHEIGADEPFLHRPIEKPEPTDEPDEKDEPAEPQPEKPANDPFGSGEDPFGSGDAGDDPFGGGDDAGDDPFGGGEDAGGDDPFDDPFG